MTGFIFPAAFSLKNFAVLHSLRGSMRASRTTIEISEPEKLKKKMKEKE